MHLDKFKTYQAFGVCTKGGKHPSKNMEMQYGINFGDQLQSETSWHAYH